MCLVVRSSSFSGIDSNLSGRRGQLKIQQMAFVLIAFMILMGLVGVFYLSLKSSSIKTDVNTLRHEKAEAMVLKLAQTPELSWTRDSCSSCIDFDKAFVLKNHTAHYQKLLGKEMNGLIVRRLYPSLLNQTLECTSLNYPRCNQITLIPLPRLSEPEDAFIALCYHDAEIRQTRCDMGTLIMGVEAVT